MHNEHPQSQSPLKDIRVIDLTSMVFGPYAMQIMAAARVALGKA